VKLAIIVQRYGDGIIGGAERHCQLLAERFAAHHEITVLTTCAKDYRTWANEIPPGSDVLRRVNVIRFPVGRKRSWRYFGWRSKRLFSSRHSILDEYRWMIEQGPECPELVQYLKNHTEDFDLFIFFTYLYYPTFFGLPMVAQKALLIPTAHDEPALHLDIFSSLFHLPRFIAFNTHEERKLVHGIFHNEDIPCDVIGVGMDLEPISKEDQGYLLYAGRIENGKNCEELFEFTRKASIPLKVIGQAQISIPDHVEFLGFVGEAEKRKLMAGCRALVIPSRNESLSLLLLEGWAHGKPGIVSAQSPVLKSHVEKSEGGGYIYESADDFCTIVHNIDSARGIAGRKYVEENYSWPKVLKKYDEAFSFLLDGKRTFVAGD